jgi:hypothetical protein
VTPRMVAVLALAGCSVITNNFDTDTFSGDPFPDHVDLSTGAILVGVQDGSSFYRPAILDIMSPVTIEDTGETEPMVTMPTLVMLGEGSDGGFDVPRASFQNANVIQTHPCDASTCTIGDGSATSAYLALLGGNTFAGNALELALGSGIVYVLADIPGTEAHRTEICDAVYPTPFRGGGTLEIDGTELDFGSFRPSLQTCLVPAPDAATQSIRGTDALLVASTGVGPTLLAESAYERFRDEQMLASGAAPPDYPFLPMATVTLSTGPVTGFLTTMPSLALVASTVTAPRSPCRQVYASHLLEKQDCDLGSGFDCPCTAGSGTFCTVPAVTELVPSGGIDVLVISDDDPVLQALRTELAPDQADVDGILGTEAMVAPVIDADYPNNRMLMRCARGTPGCTVRPELDEQSFRTQMAGCVGVDVLDGSGSGSGIIQ